MTTSNRAALLAKVHKVLKKHYKPYTVPEDRTVLEHLLYACCLENGRYEVAEEAFAKLKEMFFDWNEIRVTTVSELAEVLRGLPDTQGAAQRIKKSLQSMFEAAYSFDLEPLRKQNLGKSEKDLEKIDGASPFVRSFVAQHALSGHSIPISKGAIEVLYAVGAVNDAEADKYLVPGMERAIPKNKGIEFGSLLQQIGADFFASPGSSKLKAILAEIDGDYKERLTRRQARAEANAASAAKERSRVAKEEAEVRAKEEAERIARETKARSSKGSASKAAAAAKTPPAPLKPASAPKPPASAANVKPVLDVKAVLKGKDKPPSTSKAAADRLAGDKAGAGEKGSDKGASKRKEEPADKGGKKSPPASNKGLVKKKPR